MEQMVLAIVQAVTIDTGITLSPTFFILILSGAGAFASLRSTVGSALKDIAAVKRDLSDMKGDVTEIKIKVAEMRGAQRARQGDA